MGSKWVYVFLFLIAGLAALFFYDKFRVAPTIKFAEVKLFNLAYEPIQFKQFEGRSAIVSFGASWCGNCIEELNILKSLTERQPNALEGIQIIVISDESIEKINRFKEKRQYPFVFLKMEKSFASLGINSIPTTYLLNKKLEIKKEQVGYLDWNDPSTREHLLKLMN